MASKNEAVLSKKELQNKIEQARNGSIRSLSAAALDQIVRL